MNIQTVTLVEVLAAARARQASLVPESAGYLMLGLGRAMAGLPLGVSLDDVHLGTDGAVTVRGARAKLDLRHAAERMRELLKRLLSVAQDTPSPLRAVAEMSLEEGDPLERLFTAITKALIPLNRSAAKRALARLSRETLRARARGLSIDGELTDLGALASDRSATAPEPEALPAPEPRAAAVAEQASEMTGGDGAEADEDIDVVFELASPSPQPVRFELATPTPPPQDEPAGVTAPAPDHASVRDAVQHEAIPDEPEPTPTVVDSAKAVETPALEDPAALEDRAAGETPPSAGPVASGAALSDAIDEVVDQLSAALGAMVAPDASDARACCDDSEEDAMVDDTTEGNDGSETRAQALEAEAELAERLLVSSAMRGRSKRERSPSKRRTRIKERILSERDDELLSRFGADEGSEDDAVQQAAASLSAMMALDLPPNPAASAPASLPAETVPATSGSEAVEPAPSPVAELPACVARRSEDELEPSTMTPPELRAMMDDAIEEAEPPSLAPAVTAPRRRLPRASVVLSALLLLGGLCAAALLHSGAERWLPAAAFGGDDTPASASCTAELALRDLPSPHEVLLGLGRAPLSTRPLPTGVRLELVAMAPGHQPERLLVPADAAWREDAGQRMLSLKAELAEGSTMAWPAAPPGDVGGVGPAGIIGFEASPPGTELWLVVAAGTGDRASVTVPCDEAAHLLVLSPDEPTQQRRASVEPELLRAAAGQGPAELSLKP